MHTTTFSEMFPVPGNGYIIDTPGIKGFGTFDMEEEEIGHYFPEIFKVSADCRYGNCTHRHEPGCAVRGQGGGKIPGCLLICHFITFPIHILTLFNSLSFKLFSFPVV